MKTLHVITSLRTGGAEKLMVDLLPRLRDKGVEVELAVFSGEETEFMRQLRDAGITVHRFTEKVSNVYNPVHVFKLIRLIKHGKYDIVHTHNTAPQIFAAISAVLCSVVLCTTEHNTSNRRRGWRCCAPIDRWMYRQYHKIICISTQTEQFLIDSTPSVLSKTLMINNGIDIKTYSKAHSIPKLKNSDEIIITMVGGFRYQKDQETVIQAMNYLPAPFRLWLVGDGDRRNIIEKRITDLQLWNRIVLWGIRSDIPEILKTSDIVVLSSHWEGFGLAAVEGMAAGKPVIASDVPGLKEVVKGAGLLFPHGDAKALATEILSLSENPKRYRSVAATCLDRAKQFDISTMVDSYYNLYNSMLNG
ncbi:MAG: glycosyltransferase [Bacteroidales bacterium]|nr:glycosyltransferase [Bacteroidales bacterium]